MSKIIKHGSRSKIDQYNVTSFSATTRGESKFAMSQFAADEQSIQEMALNPKAQAKKDKDNGKQTLSKFEEYERQMLSTDSKPAVPRLFAAYLGEDEPSYGPKADAPKADAPKAPRLFAAYDDADEPSYGPKEPQTPPQQGSPRLFASYEPDEAEESMSKRLAEKSGPDFQEMDTANNTPKEGVKLPDSQKQMAEHNAVLAAVEKELTSLKTENAKLQEDLAAAQKKAADLEASLPATKEASQKEGYDAAKADFEKQEKLRYEAEQKDYLGIVEKHWQEAVSEIKKINDTLNEVDQQMPQIVIAYVKEIIGTERKLNDKLVTSIIGATLERLKDLQQIVFTVNPDDASVIAEKFPQYGVSIDPNIPKGGIKVRTKVGEIDLSIDDWVTSLEKQINEQLTNSQNNKA